MSVMGQFETYDRAIGNTESPWELRQFPGQKSQPQTRRHLLHPFLILNIRHWGLVECELGFRVDLQVTSPINASLISAKDLWLQLTSQEDSPVKSLEHLNPCLSWKIQGPGEKVNRLLETPDYTQWMDMLRVSGMKHLWVYLGLKKKITLVHFQKLTFP